MTPALPTASSAYGLEGPSANATVDNATSAGLHLSPSKFCPNKRGQLCRQWTRSGCNPKWQAVIGSMRKIRQQSVAYLPFNLQFLMSSRFLANRYRKPSEIKKYTTNQGSDAPNASVAGSALVASCSYASNPANAAPKTP